MKSQQIVRLFALVLISTSLFAQPNDAEPDNRISLGFNASEKAEFLSEMRQMLASIQAVTSGIAEEDIEKIVKAAKYSGNQMARNTPMSIKTDLKNKPPHTLRNLLICT